MLRLLSLFLLLATMSLPVYSEVYGSIDNFDVVNDTGETAHGFEIEIEDIHSNDITSVFGSADRWPNMERYGAPTIVEFSDAATGRFGVKITYLATNNGSWSAGTPSGTLPVSPSDSCWPLGAKDYGPLYPCDHFGVSARVNTPKVKYSWLVETRGNPSVLTPVLATVPNPVWTVTPVPPVANVPQPPIVHVAIAAPAPNQFEFGEPRWVKVTATGTMQNVAVEDLVAENAVLQKAKTQTQLEWQLLQVDAGKPGSGQIDLTGVKLDEGAAGVVYRFEFYEYTGARDPETNEAKPNGSDTPGIAGPAQGDLGKFIVAQNAGINFDGVIPPAPPLPIAPSLNAAIAGATVGSPYKQVIDAVAANLNDVLVITVTGLPAGLSFDNNINAIVGTPTVIGSFPLVINVQDVTNGTSISATTSIDVADAPIVFNLVLDQGTVGLAYGKQLTVTGGYGLITYSVFGSLPSGLSLTGDTISGTPVAAGSTPVTITATDELGYSQVATATLTIVAAPVVEPPPPPPVPVACSGTNKAVSNVSKFWLDIAGGIPSGGQSVIYAPEANTSFVAPLLKADGFKAGQLVSYAGTLDNQNFCVATTMTVAAGLSLNAVSLVNGQVDVAYPATAVTAAGGIAPYTLAVSGLPAGMIFDGTSIVGTPTVSGTFTVMVSVSDANGGNVFSNLTLVIDPAPVVPVTISGTLGNGQAGVAYSGSLTATGGKGTLSWSLTGAIPGVNFTNGVFTGTPTTAGTYPLVVTAADASGTSGSASYTVTIASAAPPPPPVLSCTRPANAVSLVIKRQKITAVTATTITLGGKVVVTGCATVTWNGAKAFVVGKYAKVNTGFTAKGINTAKTITMN